MNKLKESILNDVKKGSEDTINASNENTSVTHNVTTRSNDTYVYGVGIFPVLAIGVCVFFLHTTLFTLKIRKSSMKNRINHRNDVICFRKNI